jgi:hypothetical protein
MTINSTIPDAELQRAWRECAVVGKSFKEAMAVPALAIAIRNKAISNRRRHQQLIDQQRFDRKRAQANDPFDL